MRRLVLTSATTLLAFLLLVPPAWAEWVWPLRGEVITPYRNGEDPYASGQHRGIDIAGAVGATVVAAASGEVRFAGTAGSSGLTVSVRTGDGRYDASYLHLSSTAVRAGDRVAAGERVGTVGTSGARSSETPHLHFGVRDAGSRHAYHDPLGFLPPPTAPQPPREAPAPQPAPVPVAPAPAPVNAPAGRRVPVRAPAQRRVPVRAPSQRRVPEGAPRRVPAGAPRRVPVGAPSPHQIPAGAPRHVPAGAPNPNRIPAGAPALGDAPAPAPSQGHASLRTSASRTSSANPTLATPAGTTGGHRAEAGAPNDHPSPVASAGAALHRSGATGNEGVRAGAEGVEWPEGAKSPAVESPHGRGTPHANEPSPSGPDLGLLLACLGLLAAATLLGLTNEGRKATRGTRHRIARVLQPMLGRR